MSLTLFIATDTVMNDLVWVELNAMFYFVFCWGVRGGVLRKSFSYLLYKTNFKSRKKKKKSGTMLVPQALTLQHYISHNFYPPFS